jgi:transcriptional regulator of acetoin/glycerol metabolism
MDAQNPQRPPVLNNEQLISLKSTNRDLIQIADPIRKMIELSVKGTEFIVTLSEKQGIVLEVRRDKDILGMVQGTYYGQVGSKESEHIFDNSYTCRAATGRRKWPGNARKLEQLGIPKP